MAKKTETENKQTVVINGEEHNVADLSQEQVMLLNHVADLENKIRQISFNLDQTQGSRNYFMGLLVEAMKAKPEVEEKTAEEASG
jgi:uncharacterized iron-regulated protein